MPTPAQRPALPDPHRLQFRAIAEKAQLGAVDAKGGRITGVSLLTADREASGHGVWIDQKTLETFLAQLNARRIKAYATHGAWGGDGTLDEVGYWEMPRIDGIQLREDFQALESWRKHEVAEFDTLFELAEKLPQEFGASLSFRMTLAWVTKDGREIATVRKWRETGGWHWEQYFDPAMPADALRDMPSVRCVEVYSADFVCVPAANDGLFRAGPVDAPATSDSPAHLPSMNKELFAKFGSNPALLAQAMKLHTENDKLTFAEIVAKVEGEQLNAELARLRGVESSFTTFTAALEKAGFKAAGDKSALDQLLTEHASFKAKATAHDSAQAALGKAGFKATGDKSATDLALSAYAQKVADIAALRAGGTVAIETGDKPAEGAGGKAGVIGLSRVEAAFAAKRTAPGKN